MVTRTNNAELSHAAVGDPYDLLLMMVADDDGFQNHPATPDGRACSCASGPHHVHPSRLSHLAKESSCPH
jgi:hypothetical protein